MAWVTKSSTETYAPPPPPCAYTRQEQWQNWWHYHWAWVLLAAAGLVVVVSVLQATVFRPRPDIRVACVTRTALPDEVLTALERELTALATDANGDGRVLVQAVPYVLNLAHVDAVTAQADLGARASLVADIGTDAFYTVFLDDPENFQKEFAALAPLDADGTVFALRWQDCPVPSSFDLGSYQTYIEDDLVTLDGAQAVQGLYLARCLPASGTVPPAEEAFWQALTQK